MSTTITIYTAGDPSVGIEGDHLTIEWNAVDPFPDPEEREESRKLLAEFWSNFLGEPAQVAFSDDPQEEEEDELDFEPFQEEFSPKGIFASDGWSW